MMQGLKGLKATDAPPVENYEAKPGVGSIQ